MKEYYERYWENGIKGKIMHEPPPEEDKLFSKRWNTITKAIGKYLNGKCLDAGSGSGLTTSELNKITPTIGLELSSSAINKARKKYPQIKFVKGSVTGMPFKGNQFDCIFASEIIEHVLDTEAMFFEFNRVLKKNGYLIITTPEFAWLKRVFIALFLSDSYFYPFNPHIRFYSKKTLAEILKKFGFKIVHYQPDGSFFGLMPKGMLVVAKKTR